MNSGIGPEKSCKSSSSKNPRWQFLSNLKGNGETKFTNQSVSAIKIGFDVQNMVESHAFGDVYLISTDLNAS